MPHNRAQSAGIGSVADFTCRELIIPRLRAQDRAGVIAELAQALHRRGTVPDPLPFFHAALNQEFLSDASLESGIALPHARGVNIKSLRMAVGRAEKPLRWGRNSSPIRLVFLLAVPATESIPYLQLLAALARAGQSTIVDALCSASSAEEMLDVLGHCALED